MSGVRATIRQAIRQPGESSARLPAGRRGGIVWHTHEPYHERLPVAIMASTLDPRAQRFLAELNRPSAPRAIVRVAPIALALRLSRALLVVSGIAGVVSLAAPSIFRDAPAYAG